MFLARIQDAIYPNLIGIPVTGKAMTVTGKAMTYSFDLGFKMI